MVNKMKLILTIVLLGLGLGHAAAQDSILILANSAVGKSKNYFAEHQQFLTGFTLIGLSHLQNEYGVKFTFDANAALKNYKANGPEEQAQMPYFKRLTKPASPVANPKKKDIDALDDMSKLMIWSIYADQIPLTTQFSELMYKFSVDSSNERCRTVCHMGLALKWLSDLDRLKDVKSLSQIKISMEKNLIENIEAATPQSDDGMEGILALMLLDKASLIKPEWIRAVAMSIRDDGGWSWDLRDKHNQFSNDHSTLLGIWVLTSYLHPEGTKSKWVLK
jgi:hypothetical protein